MYYYDGSFGGMHLIWWFIWSALLAWIFFAPSGMANEEEVETDPLTDLDLRFAKGEITKEEYVRSKKTVKPDTPHKH